MRGGGRKERWRAEGEDEEEVGGKGRGGDIGRGKG